MHTLASSVFVAAPLQVVWDFFSDPRNLVHLTPPTMHLTLAPGAPARTAAGSELEFRLRLLGLPLRWKSLIEAWEPRRSFVDRQLRGPYRHWRHQHHFFSAEGGTWIRDVVDYALPFGPLGRAVHRLQVKRMLDHLFAYRGAAARRLLEGGVHP